MGSNAEKMVSTTDEMGSEVEQKKLAPEETALEATETTLSFGECCSMLEHYVGCNI